jgi:putative regulatory protein, FmdB family
MPLYEYKCVSCGDVFEVIQKFSDAPLSSHDKCGGAVERVLSTPAFQFKGSGWYITDYARSGGGKGSSSGDNTDISEAKLVEPKSDSKSDSKSASSGS